jgi:predicted alpha/beta superfamily hydrolase
MKTTFTTLLLFLSLYISAQYKVTLMVTVPKADANKPLFFASNVNNWSPNDAKYELKKNKDNTFTLDFVTNIENIKGKFTNGSWRTVELNANQTDIEDRTFIVNKNSTFNITVAAFKKEDTTPQIKIEKTRSSQVIIVNDSFYIPQLNTTRRIWMYVPKDYNSSKKYPVLYMHDGQNLFDTQTAFNGDWGIDDYLDNNNKNIIVVGIDNAGEKRIQEYNPYNLAKYPDGKGKAYVDFIVKTLKSFIDSNYKTLTSKANTFIAGSSMGGLISHYAVLQYPNVFGKVGIFSPSYWVCMNEIKVDISKMPKTISNQYFLYNGLMEGGKLNAEVNIITDALKKANPKNTIERKISKEGRHSEQSWKQQIPDFINWLLKK